MRKSVRWITETGVMLALLIALQWVGSQIPEPMTKQLVTGSMVNMVLAVTVLVAGLPSGITVALISPVMAYVLEIPTQAVAIPAIMVGNTVFVVLLYFLAGKSRKLLWCQLAAWIIAAVSKFAVLYALVVWVICGLFLTDNPQSAKLLAAFSWPQLVTALIGGGVALSVVPLLRKALKR